MRKFVSLFLSLLLILMIMPIGIFTASADTDGFFTFDVYNNKASIRHCETSITDAAILRKKILNFAISNDLAYDINGDGISDARDLVNIKKQIANSK